MYDDFDDIWGMGMMGDGKEDPKEQRKKLYITIVALNVFLSGLYLFLSLFFSWGPFRVLKELLTVFPTSFAVINIALYIQVFVTFVLVKQLSSGARKKTKENILGAVWSANFILCLILLGVAYKSYVWETTFEANATLVIATILSLVALVYTSRGFILNVKEIIEDYRNQEEEEEEEDEEPVQKYDWITQFYNTNINVDVEEDMEYFRFHALDRVFPFLISHINSTLSLEKDKLVNKDVVKAWNQADNIVQVDYPIINSQDDIEELIDKEDFGFSNPYIVINNSYVAFKLKTTYLSNPKRLQEIGEQILPTQKSDAIKQVPFRPLSMLEPGTDEYTDMIEWWRMSNGKITKYTLFSNIGIDKIKNDWYVIFTYTKWYKNLVTFKRLKALPDILEEETEGFWSQKFNSKLLFGYKSIWGYVGLNLKQIRHLLFWGQSSSGKSVYLSSIIYQILYLSHPSAIKLLLIDPLRVSFRPFKKIKHLFGPVAMSEEEAIEAIQSLVEENRDRYGFLEALGYEDIYEYNSDIWAGMIKSVDSYGLSTKKRIWAKKTMKNSNLEQVGEGEIEALQKAVGEKYKVGKVLPQLVLIYDEFNAYNGYALYEKYKIVDKLVKLWEQARKAGIILILGTQKIDAESVPSKLRENFPTRVCLKVATSFNSKAILWEQAENKTAGSLLSGSGDMLVYNGESLDLMNAERAQGFYVSKEATDELLRRNFEAYGTNDFVYKEKEEDNYNWIEAFYKLEETDDMIISRNVVAYNQELSKGRGIEFIPTYNNLIRGLNTFLKANRLELLDKESLENESKNVEIDTLRYTTQEELEVALESLDFNNQYINLTKSYIELRVNTQYLNSGDKLIKLEEAMANRLGVLRASLTFTPKKVLEEGTKEYKRMLEEGVPYQLISNFEVVKIKTHYYIRANFTPSYKLSVIFPNSKTIPQILAQEKGEKLSYLEKGIVYIINKWVITVEE